MLPATLCMLLAVRAVAFAPHATQSATQIIG